jgi:RNA recognition motif-containing protein
LIEISVVIEFFVVILVSNKNEENKMMKLIIYFSGSRTNKFELEKEFDSFGPLVDCWVARNPPGFAFIVYKHADDAERAVEELDGR